MTSSERPWFSDLVASLREGGPIVPYALEQRHQQLLDRLAAAAAGKADAREARQAAKAERTRAQVLDMLAKLRRAREG